VWGSSLKVIFLRDGNLGAAAWLPSRKRVTAALDPVLRMFSHQSATPGGTAVASGVLDLAIVDRFDSIWAMNDAWA